MSHLGDGAFVDILEGRADGGALAHLRGCASCAARLAEAEDGLAAARRDVVPEPSALFWEAFRRNVGRRIGEEPRPAHRLAWLLPVAAAAGLAVVVVVSRPAVAPPSPAPSAAAAEALPPWSALPPLDEDDAVPLLEGLVAAPGAAAWEEGEGADAFVAGLSDDESSSLARTLGAAAGIPPKGEDL